MFVYVVEAMIAVYFMHAFHLPLLYVVGVRVWQVKQPFAEMKNHRVLTQLFLIVKALGQYFLFFGAADNCALVGEGQLFCLYQTAGLF